MKKLILPILLAVPTIFFAQNIKKEKVKTSFLSYPKINMTNIDVSTLKADFCAGDIKFVSQSVRKGANACKAAGGKAKVIEIFYYQLGMMGPNSYLRISDNTGNIKYAKQITWKKAESIEYGKKSCYWTESILKSKYEKERLNFASKTQKAAAKKAMKTAKTFLNGALTFTYVADDIEVYYVKDKSGTYSDLKKAAATASEGYAGLKGKSGDSGSQSKLREAITIWEKAMTESKPDQKDARINKKVTMHISENLGRAYMYLMDFDKARSTIQSSLDLQKNVSNNGKVRRKALLREINDYKKGYDLNKEMPINTKSVKIPFTLKPKSDLAQFISDNKKYGTSEGMENAKISKEEYNKGVASGEINKYQKFVVEVAGGNMLTLPDLASKITGDPAGSKLDEFPEELTDLDITTLILRNNNIATVPPSIGKMTKLKKLILTNNQLTNLPDEIGELKALKTLVIKGNKVSAKEVSRIQALLPGCKIKN